MTINQRFYNGVGDIGARMLDRPEDIDCYCLSKDRSHGTISESKQKLTIFWNKQI